jgi:hypothetical protein
MIPQTHMSQSQYSFNPYQAMMNHHVPPPPTGPVNNLLNFYLNQEGIDGRYSQLILKELHDATDMTSDQLNQAANEILTKSISTPTSTATPLTNHITPSNQHHQIHHNQINRKNDQYTTNPKV